MPVLDTNILVSLLKGDPSAINTIKKLEETGVQISTTIITAYELLKGAFISSKQDANLKKVRESLANVRVLELSLGACEEASRIYKESREKGRMIGEFDILIAAIASFNDEELITRDEDFSAIRGIKITKW